MELIQLLVAGFVSFMCSSKLSLFLLTLLSLLLLLLSLKLTSLQKWWVSWALGCSSSFSLQSWPLSRVETKMGRGNCRVDLTEFTHFEVLKKSIREPTRTVFFAKQIFSQFACTKGGGIAENDMITRRRGGWWSGVETPLTVLNTVSIFQRRIQWQSSASPSKILSQVLELRGLSGRRQGERLRLVSWLG